MTPEPRKSAVVLPPVVSAVLERRYLRKDTNGRVVETFEDMLWRVASHAAQAERRYGCEPQEWAKEFFDMMADLRFLPNSPCLVNAGTKLGQLAACFVLPVEDSLEAIFAALKEAALIHKSGGGTGFSFSRLRPRGDVVASTHGVSSGPISFLQLYDLMAGIVRQGGRRRGANMGILRVDHPDILDFINAKRAPGALENFNLSVGVTGSQSLGRHVVSPHDSEAYPVRGSGCHANTEQPIARQERAYKQGSGRERLRGGRK